MRGHHHVHSYVGRVSNTCSVGEKYQWGFFACPTSVQHEHNQIDVSVLHSFWIWVLVLPKNISISLLPASYTNAQVLAEKPLFLSCMSLRPLYWRGNTGSRPCILQKKILKVEGNHCFTSIAPPVDAKPRFMSVGPWGNYKVSWTLG